MRLTKAAHNLSTMHVKLVAPLVISFVTWSCTTRQTSELLAHQIKHVTGSTNNKLEVLDWG